MKVAWVTHHLVRDERRHSSLLPGKHAGGAEMNNDVMVSHAPDGVEVDWVGPDEWHRAMDYDRVVVTGTDKLSDAALRTLAVREPLVWIQHAQSRSEAKRDLFLAADPFVTMSKLHMEHEAKWVGRADRYCHSVFNTAEIKRRPKKNFALFAARDHPLKGLTNARLWARDNGVDLVELVNVPRKDVLKKMAIAKWFVHLPKEFDACPRTVMEATIAGCEIVTNPRIVGRIDEGDPVEVINAQPAKFWGWV